MKMNKPKKKKEKKFSTLQKLIIATELTLVALLLRELNKKYGNVGSLLIGLTVHNTLKKMLKRADELIPQAVLEEYKNPPDVISRTMEQNLRNTIRNTAATVEQQIKNEWENYKWQETYMVGRRHDDIFREKAIETYNERDYEGHRIARTLFREKLEKNGITGFIDKASRKWRLTNYTNMVMRTMARQISNLSILAEDWDLYKMTSHSTTCPICLPLQGRVYSKSGKNPNYPPLASAFGKIDKNGSNELWNTYLTIHPNCLHSLVKYNEADKTSEELQKMRDFSSFSKNPPIVNEKANKDLQNYRKKVAGEQKLNRIWNEWELMKKKIDVPKFRTFLTHALKRDEKYKEWKRKYKMRNINLRG